MKRSLALLFVAFQVADSLSTWAALHSGRFTEANPWFSWLFSHGLLVGMTVKVTAGCVVLGAALWLLSGRRRMGALLLLVAISAQPPVTNLLRMRGWA